VRTTIERRIGTRARQRASMACCGQPDAPSLRAMLSRISRALSVSRSQSASRKATTRRGFPHRASESIAPIIQSITAEPHLCRSLRQGHPMARSRTDGLGPPLQDRGVGRGNVRAARPAARCFSAGGRNRKSATDGSNLKRFPTFCGRDRVNRRAPMGLAQRTMTGGFYMRSVLIGVGMLLGAATFASG
jgi:hypothetical protein